MTDESPARRLTSTPMLATEPNEDTADHGRVGYGRWGRYSPLLLGFFLILAVVLTWWVQRDASPAGPPLGTMSGQPAPEFTLTLFDGNQVTLSDLRGKVVVLNFWASWCAPCRAEMPELQAYWDEARRNGEETEIIGIGVRTDTEVDARRFVADGGFTYPIGRDTNTDRPGIGPIEATFGLPSAYPATIVIRPDGIVDRYHLGPLNREMLRLMVDEARQSST